MYNLFKVICYFHIIFNSLYMHNKLFIFLIIFSSLFYTANADSIDFTEDETYSLILRLDNINKVKLTDSLTNSQFYNYKGKELILYKDIGITSRYVFDKRVNSFLFLDNFTPYFFNPILELELLLNNIIMYKKIVNKQIYFYNKERKPTITLKVVKNKENISLVSLVSSDKSFNKSVLKIFDVKTKNYNKIEIFYKVDEIANFSFDYLKRDDFLDKSNFMGFSKSEIVTFTEKLLYKANSYVESIGNSFVTGGDISKILDSYNPVEFPDLSLKIVENNLEVYSYILDKYFCGSLVKSDYFLETAIVIDGKCS